MDYKGDKQNSSHWAYFKPVSSQNNVQSPGILHNCGDTISEPEVQRKKTM